MMAIIISTSFSADRNHSQSVGHQGARGPLSMVSNARFAVPGRIWLSTIPRMNAHKVRIITIRTPLAPVFLRTAVSRTIECEHMTMVQRIVKARQSSSSVVITAMQEYTFTK